MKMKGFDTDTDITDRRAFLIAAASIAGATILLGTAVVAQYDPDPIFAAITAHRKATRTVDAAYAKLLQADDTRLADTEPMQIALNAEYRAADAMIGTAPTTRAGVRALAAHLGDERNYSAVGFIRRPIVLDGVTVGTQGGGDGAVEWLLAKHAEAIAV
jgi:hypothetical protein